jgi:molybdopterin-guanine dinucleotide biosynthesis protein A
MTSVSQITAVVASDLPFADGELLARGYQILGEQDWDGFVPRTQAGLEPLHALYRTQPCLPHIEKALSEGEQKVSGWFVRAKVYEYDLEEKEPSPFINVNTPAEFERAEQWARSFDDI